MALPTVKLACSNGHFQESIQNFGDRGTWSSVGSYSGGNTVLTDKNANWVTDEWIGYRIRVDVNDANTIATVVDNDETSITVSGNHSGLTAGTDTYRIGAGLIGTVTANASSSTTITIGSITNKWGTTVVPKEDELIGMTFVPDKLDGTSYAITDNSAVTSGTMTITIGTSIVVTATSFEIGRGASGTLYPSELIINAELNEPKQLVSVVEYDIVGTNKFEQEKDMDNPLMLGSLVRVTETTGNKTIFEGHIHDAPTQINSELRAIQFTAYDKLAILDYTVIPSTTIGTDGTLPTYSFADSTPLVESNPTGFGGDNKVYQTKAFDDYTYVPQPFAYAGTVNSNGTIDPKTSGGSTANNILEPDSGTPFDTDLIAKGCVVINTTTKRTTHIKVVNDNNTITCTDEDRDGSGNPFWTSGDKYIILSKNWQVGEGIESDSSYTTNQGWGMNTVLREDLTAPSSESDDSSGTTQIFVGRSSGTQDVEIPFTGRGWVMIIDTSNVEICHYSGYQRQDGKYYLYAYNKVAQSARHTRGDLTNVWSVGAGTHAGRAWTASSSIFVMEIFPNRFGVDPPKVFLKEYSPVAEIGVVASEGIVQLNQGDAKWNGQTSLYCHQYSYDGDASTDPDKGTDDESLDISEVVQTAVTGLVDHTVTEAGEDIISKSKLAGGAGLPFDRSESSNTGVKINTIVYTAYGKTEVPIHPKRLIEKLCDDAGILFDLRYDDNSERIVFNPLTQKSSADITIASGSVTALTRERDLSDVYSAMLLQVQTPDNNYFAPENILQYTCNFQDSGVGANQKSTVAQTGFNKDGYTTGTSIPRYFWDSVHLRGLGKDVSNYTSATAPFGNWSYGGMVNMISTTIYQEAKWFLNSTSMQPEDIPMLNSSGVAGVPTLSDDGNETPLHLVTMWFRDGVALDIDSFEFKSLFAGEIANGATYRVEVSTDIDVTNPFSGSTTWHNFNSNSSQIAIANTGAKNQKRWRKWELGQEAKDWINMTKSISSSGTVKLSDCQVKGVKGIRILSLASPSAQQGWWGEGRELLRDNDLSNGIQTFGWNIEWDGTSTGFGTTSEAWTRPDKSRYTRKAGKEPKWNNNRQDGAGWQVDPSDIPQKIGNRTNRYRQGSPYPTTSFVNAIENSLYAKTGTTSAHDAADTRAGYVQLTNMLGNFKVTGVGKKALFVRVTKDQTTKRDTERKSFSPSYKKIAGMGYKTSPIPLTNFSISEAQGLGQRYIDDKLRRYQARDYSLDGKSPFLNSNNLPFIGQTIAIADDTQGTSGGSSFSGIMTQYVFTFNAEGARLDFRLEDYDTYNTATYIQAGDED